MDDLFVLKINRIFPVGIKKVWDAWTIPEQIKLWWGVEGYETNIDKMEVEVGGSFQLRVKSKGKPDHVCGGVFKEVLLMKKLVYSWNIENEQAPTKLTVMFISSNKKETEVQLYHEGFPNELICSGYNTGWLTAFHNLDGMVCGPGECSE